MKKLILFGAAGLALSLAQPAFAADLAPYPVKAPFAARFTWTGCYAGGQVGGMWSNTSLTDPVALVQNSINPGVTVGTTTAGVDSTGFTIGGQIGCDYQFAPSWVAGLEGAAVAATNSATSNVALQNPGDFESIAVKTDLVTSVTGRLGYAVDHWLFYGKGGVAWASNKYSITGSYTGVPFDSEGQDIRIGWTAGAGVEWAFAEDWSARLEYDYYGFGTRTVNMIDAANAPLGNPLGIKQNMQAVKLGVNFHVWGWQ
jgi:outer membrane immunogenic protein